MTGTLDGIVTRCRERFAQGRGELERVLAAAAVPGERRDFAARLRGDGPSVIAEFKRRSPSRGAIREDLTPADVARQYERAGAAALSVLTEPEFFAGALDDLRQARSATELPALRKDFVVDELQVLEARLAGADAVLLIVAALSDDELLRLLREAEQASLDALVEVHDAAELTRALDAGAQIVGVNNRNLHTMQVRLETSLELAAALPDHVVRVAESGIRSGADVRRLREAGFDAVLVGEHLMSAPEPGAALAQLLAGAAQAPR